jgi:hypothetical protein
MKMLGMDYINEINKHILNINNSHEYSNTYIEYENNILYIAIRDGSKNFLDRAIKEYTKEIINKYFVGGVLIEENKSIMVYSRKYTIEGIRNEFGYNVENKYFLKKGHIYYSLSHNKNFTYLNTIIDINTMLVLFENDMIATDISLHDIGILKYVEKNINYKSILEIQKDYDFSYMDTRGKLIFLSATYQDYTLPTLNKGRPSEILINCKTPREYLNQRYK